MRKNAKSVAFSARPASAALAWFAVLFAPLAAGCFTIGAKPSDAKSRTYTIGNPGTPWEPTEAGTMDVAYRAAEDGATLSLNSVCDQYQKNSLEELRKSSLAGIGAEKRLSERAVTVGGFPALETIVVGELDGAIFKLAHTVVRSPRCVYDLTLVSRPELYASHEAAYAAFVASFHEEGGRS